MSLQRPKERTVAQKYNGGNKMVLATCCEDCFDKYRDRSEGIMKLIHISDLHLGKRLNEYSLLEDQEYILTKIINMIDDEKPEGVIIAGDVYDKSVPSAEAITLFDEFLVRLSARNLKVFIISGNHDSPERLSFANRLINQSGVYISPVYNGEISPVTLSDEFGNLSIFMLPFIKPANVKRFYPDEELGSYKDAVKVIVKSMVLDPENRNILITHQFVTGATRCDSEDIAVGGSDNIDADVFEHFDYVALGHIHGPQSVTRKTIRYCGTPLKYSFSEVSHEKSVTVIELREKGNIEIRTLPLKSKRDMREIKGKYNDLMLKENYEDTNVDDYIHITLTDEDDIPYAINKLGVVYHNIMKLDYDNKRTRSNAVIAGAEDVKQRSPMDLFEEFFEKQNNQKMNDKQRTFTSELIEKIWEGAK